MKSAVEDTLFVKALGGSPINKVLIFLIENNVFDYSKSDIAKNCDISRVTLDAFIDNLIKMKIIKMTRQVGRATLYKINLESEIVKELIRLNELITRKYASIAAEREKVYA